jgi:hypothetical protein
MRPPPQGFKIAMRLNIFDEYGAWEILGASIAETVK